MNDWEEKPNSGWTFETLKHYLEQRGDDHARLDDQRHAASDKAIEAAFQSAKDARITAERAYDRRFDQSNEIKAMLEEAIKEHAEELGRLLPRTEYERMHTVLVDRVAELQADFKALLGERKGVNALWVVLLGVISLLSALSALLERFWRQ